MDVQPAVNAIAVSALTSNTDLFRPTYAVFGLPFDAVCMSEAVAIVEKSVRERTRCFISTPNVNFAIAARNDYAFRQSVLQSNLVLADGQPIVWAAQLIGAPIRERVSGAGLFEQLRQHAAVPIKVYFFGGPDGAAQTAHESMNKTAGPLRSVGFCSPGFVSVAAMSEPAFIDAINAAQPDFLVVALGAKKGQEWILANLGCLHAPVISHLGAVVNFTAGTLKRAPVWVQKVGAEWLWRIVQEPQLWRRYWSDGLQLSALVRREVLPLVWARTFYKPRCEATCGAPHRVSDGVARMAVAGDWLDDEDGKLANSLSPLVGHIHTFQIDAHDLNRCSPRIHALFLLIEGSGVSVKFFRARPAVKKALANAGCGHWLAI